MLRSVAAALAISWVAAPSATLAAGTVKDCIQSWPEARYRALGYNHIVHVRDVCDARAECDVSTDVAPEPQRVLVPARSEIEVTTFLGSPARVFTPRVDCRLIP